MSTPPIDFLGRQQLGTDDTWRARCQVAGCQAAANVMSESAATAGHDLRADYASKFLNASGSMSGPLAVAVASAPGIVGAEATDSDIAFTVSSIWNAMAGYSPNP